ncbi:MAG TPA: DUF11 domain-containing protein, partial [Thermoanaerobaculia bacterium]|nr:DUF11 domain-containing protein [Thermoanaerobaculia bacterium]
VLALALLAFASVANATIYLVSGTSPDPANWTDTSLWSPAGFPGSAAGDFANDVGIDRTIIVNSVIPNDIAGALFSCACVIDLQPGGQLTLGGATTLNNGAKFKIDGGTLIVNSTLTLNSASIHLISGTLGGSGTISLDANSALNMDSNGNPTIDTVTINNAGTITLNPPAPGGMLNLSNNVHLNNSGTFDIQANLSAINCGSASVIANSGTLRKWGGDMTTIYAAVNNVAGASAGVVVDNASTLALADGGNGDAPFAINDSSVLAFPSALYTMGTGGVVSGSGTLMINGGTLSIGGVTSPGGFVMTAGTLTGAGFLSIVNTMNWSGGTIAGTGGTELAGNGSGTISGADGAMTLDGRVFNDYGFINYTATTNSLTLVNNAVFAVFGSFDFQDDGSVNGSSPASLTVSPNGGLSKNGGVGISSINVPFTNNASVFCSTGMLKVAGNGTHNGSFFTGSGGTIEFAAGSTTINNGFVGGDGVIKFSCGGSTDISGTYQVTGTTVITSASVTFNSPASTKDLTFESGDLYAEDVFTLTGSGSWSGGEISAGGINGEFVVDTDASLTIDGVNGTTSLVGTPLTNNGSIAYTSTNGNLEIDGAAIQNNGTFDIQTDNDIVLAGFIGDLASSPDTFENIGTLKKTAAGGVTDFEPELDNSGTVEANNGTLHFTGPYNQNDGETKLGGSTISTDTELTITGGAITGAGTITGNVKVGSIVIIGELTAAVITGANIAPGSGLTTGTITINGNYTQLGNGTMAIDIDAGSFDVVAVTGDVTLDGEFSASLLNSYQPPNGTTWNVLTFANRSGDFSTYSLPSYGFSGQITSSYLPNALQLAAATNDADVQITKAGPNGVTAGQNIVYTITVTNNGPSTATNVVVSDSPTNATFVSNSGDCTGAFPCNFASLLAGQTVTITSTFSTSPSFSGNVTNTATVSSSTPDPNNSNNSSTKITNVGAQSDLAVTKTGPASASLGTNVSYTITVTNNGPSPATNVIVSDPTPVGVAFQSNTGDCVSAYPCNVGALAAGQSKSITSTYTIPSNYGGATVSNTATASSDVNDPNNANNSSTQVT